MATITDVPLDDIKLFLTSNNRPIPQTPEKIYLTAIDLIRSGTAQNIPPSIADFIIATNLASHGIKVPTIKLTDILNANDNDLRDLSNLLTLSYIDKERIIRILDYLDVLINDSDIFDTLSPEIFEKVVEQLDCRSMLLLCQLSNKFQDFCQFRLDDLLRKKLSSITKLNLTNYSRLDLVRLCQFPSHYPNNISVASVHTLLLNIHKEVYVCGDNNAGQLGLGDYSNKNTPTKNDFLQDIVQVAAGYNHSLVLSEDGLVYSFGRNTSGCLGIGLTSQELPATSKPTIVIEDIIQVAAGNNHSLVLDRDGNVLSCGNNSLGQLGLGDNIYVTTMEIIPSINNIIQISTGIAYSLALTNTGQVYAWGYNSFGQLGLGYIFNTNIPTLLSTISNIVQVSAGSSHSLMLNNEGKVYGCGANNSDQPSLGLGDTYNKRDPTLNTYLNNIVYVSAGAGASLTLDKDGQVYAFGRNEYGLFGSNIQQIIPLLLSDMNDIIQIANKRHIVLLQADGRIYVHGPNSSGQLGLGDNNDRNMLTVMDFNIFE